MALVRQIGTETFSLKCVKPGGQVYELAVNGAITLTRSQNTASKLSCKVLRDHITVELADTIDLVVDEDHHQFFGIVTETRKEDKWCTITAYDQLYYLNRNKKRMCYEDITLKELIARVCTDRGYNFTDDGLEETLYKLPARTEENTTDLAIITNGIEATHEAVKVKYFLWDDAGFIRLNSTNWLAGEPRLLVQPGYFEDYSLTNSMDEGYSVVRLEEKITNNQPTNTEDTKKEKKTEEEKAAEKAKKEAEKASPTIKTYIVRNDDYNTKFGTLEYVGQVEEGENGQDKAQKLLDDYVKKFDEGSLSISRCQGDITVRGGTPLLVDFYSEDRQEYIRGWYEVESVTHTLDNGWHTMDLELTCMLTFNEWENTDESYYSHWALNGNKEPEKGEIPTESGESWFLRDEPYPIQNGKIRTENGDYWYLRTGRNPNEIKTETGETWHINRGHQIVTENGDKWYWHDKKEEE